MLYICAKMLKETGSLVDDLVTTTVMSNIGFHKAIEALGLNVEVTQVGDRYVLESMLKNRLYDRRGTIRAYYFPKPHDNRGWFAVGAATFAGNADVTKNTV